MKSERHPDIKSSHTWVGGFKSGLLKFCNSPTFSQGQQSRVWRTESLSALLEKWEFSASAHYWQWKLPNSNYYRKQSDWRRGALAERPNASNRLHGRVHKLLHSRLGVHSGAAEESTGQIPRQSRGIPTVNKARSRRTGPEASEKCVCLSVSSLQQAIWESTWIHFSKYKECRVLHLHVNAILCTAAVSSSGRSGVLAGWKSKLDVWETVQHPDIPVTKSNLFWKGWQIITDDFYQRKSITAHPINHSFLLEKHHIWILFLLKTLVSFFFFALS